MFGKSLMTIAALAVAASTAQAQALTATVVVNGATITTSPTTQLNFSSIIPGASATIAAVTSASAGMYTVSGASAIPLGTIQVVFPTTLVCSAGSCVVGTDNLPFSAPSLAVAQTNGGVRVACTGGTAPTLNCSTGPTPAQRTPSGGQFFIHVGGTATAGAAQAPGTYTGTLNATVNY